MLRRRSLLALLGALAAVAWAAGSASAEPLHVMSHQRFAQPPTTAECEADFGTACYGAPQLEQAYGLNPLYNAGLTGAGKTIVILDAFGSPTVTTDLAQFDSAYGLPAPPSLNIIAPSGAIPPFDPTNDDHSGWGEETSLDVEYSHAIAPGANILLVETPVAETEGTVGLPEIVAAENYVIDHHLGDVITQSFGASEPTFPSPASIYGLRSAVINAASHHVTVLASSGDNGPTNQDDVTADSLYPFPVNSWPSADPLVTSVGGTQLHLDAAGNRTAPDNVWNDEAVLGAPIAGGGGLSSVFRRPFYQDSVRQIVGGQRGTPDVSMDAAVDGGVPVYIGFTSTSPDDAVTPGWYVFGGTSEASPEFAGIVAIADQAAHRDLGLINPTLYSRAWRESGLTDITTGDTTVSFTNPPGTPYPGDHTVTGFSAVPGYDLASGLGTPNGAATIAELASRFHGQHRGRSRGH